MPIATSCPHCGQPYNLADSQHGKTVQCRACSRPFQVGEDDRRRREDDERRPRRRARGPAVPLIVWLLLGGGLAVVSITGIVVAVLAFGPFGTRVTVDNFRKLRQGMTEQEVTAILGPGADVTRETFDDVARQSGMPGLMRSLNDGRFKVLRWQSGPNQITLALYNGRVVTVRGHFGTLGNL